MSPDTVFTTSPITPRVVDTELSLIHIRAMPEEQAATLLDGRLRALESIWKRSFAERGLILIEMQERKLWRFLVTSDGLQYGSFEAWVVAAAPQSRSDCFAAMRVIRELKDVPVAELSQMPRCNLSLMQGLSSGVRQQPEVIEAAKTLPEREFVAKIQADFPAQHIESRQAVMMPKEDCAEFEAAIARSMERGATTRAEAIKDISINYLLDYPEVEQTA